MKTLKDLNNILKEYPMFISFKLFGEHSKYKDYEIIKFGYSKGAFIIYATKGTDVFLSGSKQYCIDKVYNEIKEKQSVGNHCLFADPL